MTLYVVRHGETDWNRQQRLQGRLDVPLNATGIAQGRALASYFRDKRLTRVLTSPLCRASATAAMIGEAASCKVESLADLAEINHGEWQGLTLEEIDVRYPGVWAAWNTCPSRTAVPGAEPLADVMSRVGRVLKRCRFSNDVCLVTHGVVSRAIAVTLLNLSPDSLFELPQYNGSVNIFDVRGRRAAATALNATSHLDTLAMV